MHYLKWLIPLIFQYFIVIDLFSCGLFPHNYLHNCNFLQLAARAWVLAVDVTSVKLGCSALYSIIAISETQACVMQVGLTVTVRC